MSGYIALARKWRPQTFSTLVGQAHVATALMNALKNNRLHHAYLFTGTHGTGKTSTARVFAKALSCEQGPSAEPCLQCTHCTAIAEGRYIDLIEIDAASKTRVEDTRELLENVSYAPTQGRFKIYLIDEVHMLSTHSFNALLKTLEEPPEHVKFLLATTEPQKLPMTVLSRCLQFHLSALDSSLIQEHLTKVLTEEHIDFEEEALAIIAKAAKGSMRDALSLLDQIIALSDANITTTSTKQALGYTKDDHTQAILRALAEKTPEVFLTISQAIQSAGGQYHYVLDELLTSLHQISVAHALQQEKPELFTHIFLPEEVQLFYHLAQKGREELMLSPTPAIGFEMTLLRMHTFRPSQEVIQPTTAPKPGLSRPLPTKTIAAKPTSPVATAPAIVQPPNEKNSWEEIIPKLNLAGLALTAVNQSALQLEGDKRAILLTTAKNSTLFTPNTTKKIEEALSKYYQKPIQVEVRTENTEPDSPAKKKRVKQEAIKAEHDALLEQDEAFQALKETFSTA